MSEILLYLHVREKNKQNEICNPIEIRFPPRELDQMVMGTWDGNESAVHNILNENLQEIKRLLEVRKEKKCEAEFEMQIDFMNISKQKKIIGNKPLDLEGGDDYIKRLIKIRLMSPIWLEISRQLTTKKDALQSYTDLGMSHDDIKIIQELPDTISEEIIIHAEIEQEEEMKMKPEPNENQEPDEECDHPTSNSVKEEQIEISVDQSQFVENKKSQPRNLPRIIVREAALKRARKHAIDESDMETGGVLLGRFLPDHDGATRVVVTGIVRGKYTIRRPASLTFTSDTWAQVLSWIDQDSIYSDDKVWTMVGWYHTHPSFGIFLSSYDLFIHKKYFTNPDHVALVIDPRKNNEKEGEGFFCWDLSMKEVSRHKFEILKDAEIQKILGLDKLPAPEVTEPDKKEQKE